DSQATIEQLEGATYGDGKARWLTGPCLVQTPGSAPQEFGRQHVPSQKRTRHRPGGEPSRCLDVRGAGAYAAPSMRVGVKLTRSPSCSTCSAAAGKLTAREHIICHILCRNLSDAGLQTGCVRGATQDECHPNRCWHACGDWPIWPIFYRRVKSGKR